MKYGLNKQDIEDILKACSLYPEIKEVIIFGSRAKGNYKKGSDIDLAIKGKNISFSIISKLNNLLNEGFSLPYFVDVINYNTIKEPKLKDHINRIGKIIYKK